MRDSLRFFLKNPFYKYRIINGLRLFKNLFFWQLKKIKKLMYRHVLITCEKVSLKLRFFFLVK